MTLIAEEEVKSILTHFNSGYVLNLVSSHLNDRYNPLETIVRPNIVSSFEQTFADLKQEYPSDVSNIEKVRLEVYDDIIKMISNTCNVRFVIQDEYDLYNSLYLMYDLFISNFCKNIVRFLSQYIYVNRNELYNALGLNNIKKDRDAESIYIKKKYEDPIMSAIISKITDVLYYVSGIDISFDQYVMALYPEQQSNIILSTVIPNDPYIFKNQFCNIMNSPATINTIRVELLKNVISNAQMAQYNDQAANIDKKDLHPISIDDLMKNMSIL
jgi:hypothetical protein